MSLTGKYQFRKTLWGKIVLQVEDEVKPLWSRTGGLKRRWRDATLMDLTAPEMRPLIDMRYKPQLWARPSLGLEAGSLLREPHEAHPEVRVRTPIQNGDVRRIEH
jgi:hypothetical protein